MSLSTSSGVVSVQAEIPPSSLSNGNDSDPDESDEEVELHPHTYKDGRVILMDMKTKKVYSHDEEQGFLGKMLTSGDIDFDAVDSSDEEDEDSDPVRNPNPEITLIKGEEEVVGPEGIVSGDKGASIQEEKKDDFPGAPSTSPQTSSQFSPGISLLEEKEKLLKEQQALQDVIKESTSEEEQLLAELRKIKEDNEKLKAKVSVIKTKTTPSLKSELETNKSSLEEIQKKLSFEEEETKKLENEIATTTQLISSEESKLLEASQKTEEHKAVVKEKRVNLELKAKQLKETAEAFELQKKKEEELRLELGERE
jgi:hypothetical protein